MHGWEVSQGRRPRWDSQEGEAVPDHNSPAVSLLAPEAIAGTCLTRSLLQLGLRGVLSARAMHGQQGKLVVLRRGSVRIAV